MSRRIFDTLVDGLITLTVQQQFRSSFDFRSQGVTAEATRKLSRTVSLIGTYQLQNTNVYNENVSPADQSAIDRVFPKVLLSSFSRVGAARHAQRSDRSDERRVLQRLRPARRERARRPGRLREVVLPRVVYRPVPQSKRIVLAGNAFLGLATGFPQQGILDPNTGQPDLSLPQSERFYAGGDTTNRGFALDQLGVRHIPSQPEDTIDVKGFPLGGNAEVLFNAEMRVPLWRGVEVHTFLDTGNVFQNTRTSTSASSARRSDSARCTSRPSDRCGSILDSRCIPSSGESPTAFFITFGQAF